MGFASPLWLLGLLPWVVVVFYLLPGSGMPATVPFLTLWRAGVTVSKGRARRWPSTPILFALLALLLAILAAAQPGLRGLGMIDAQICIVLDRGATMALPSASGKVFRNVISRVGPIGNRTRVNLIPVPGQSISTTGDAWVKAAEGMPPTAVSVHLDPSVTEALRQVAGPVLVLSDQRLGVDDKRIAQIQPEPVIGTVAITAIEARAAPRSQVMVRLENHSDLASVALIVRSGDATLRREVALPVNGGSTDQFLDLPSLADTVTARVELDHEQSPWLKGQLVRQSNGVRIAVDPAADDAVRRLAEIYAKNRPAPPDARQILISNHALDRDQSGIWMAEPSSGATGVVGVVLHEVSRNVLGWPAAGTVDMPVGFVPIVTVGDHPMVTVREDSVRQVWINADLREWEKTPDFVVFFANALQWLGGSEQQYVSVLPGLGREWSGLYPVAGGKKMAVNAGEYPSLNVGLGQEVGRAKNAAGGISLTAPVIFSVLGCLGMAALFWRSTTR